MYSRIVPFTDILDDVADDTGIINLDNMRPKIRRLIYRIEKQIGFGGTALLKKIKYSVEAGTIDITGEKYKIKLPSDIQAIEEVGMCENGLCPNDYYIQGNWMFLCTPITEFYLIYWTLLCDGEGNPVITENHREAVVAGLSWKLLQPSYRQGKIARVIIKDLENEYIRALGEAIGDDIWPDTDAVWAQAGRMLQMNHKDAIVFLGERECYCCIVESPNLNESTQIGDVVYYWQFDNATDDISLAPSIDQDFLDDKNFATIGTFLDGFVVPYDQIGRIAFALQNVTENYYQIQDIFGNDITSTVFDTYYNSDLNMQIYISKFVYSFGNIYFKLVQNP